MRSASASTVPPTSPTLKCTSARSAGPRIWATASSIKLAAVCGRFSRNRRPVCIRSTSRTSLSKCASRCALSTAMPTTRCPRGESGPSTPPASRPSEPRMLVSGVRSSWPTTDNSSSFMRSIARRSPTSRINSWTAGRPSNETPAAVTSASIGCPSRRSRRALLGGAIEPAAARLRNCPAARTRSRSSTSVDGRMARNSAALVAPNRRTPAALIYSSTSSATTRMDSGESSTRRR